MNSHFERHLQIGRQLFAVAGYERAAREFEAALEFEPDNNYARLYLARCYLNLKRMKEARAAVERALQNDPSDADAHYMAAYVARNNRAALDAIDAALQLSPFRDDYHGHRAFILSRLGKYALGLESARRALEIAPDSAAAHRQYAGVLFDEAERIGLGRAKREAATFHVERALEIEPDNALSQTALARLRGFELEPEESLEKWREALRLDPNDAYAQSQHRKARGAVRIARFALGLWRVFFRWMPWPLRLPVLAAIVTACAYWSLVVPRGRGFWSGEPWFFVLGFWLCLLLLPLLLRDWLQHVPDRFLGNYLHPLKKPPLQ